MPKKHLTKIGSDQNPTLLHVAARAAINFKDQTYVALVAILSVLVNFNKTLYHSMDDDTSTTRERRKQLHVCVEAKMASASMAC